MKKKILAVAMAACMVLSVAACGQKKEATGTQEQSTAASAGKTIKVGIINNDPSESGYRSANVADMERVFCEENGYEVKKFCSGDKDGQKAQAQQMIQDGIQYLLISAGEASGWDSILKDAKDAGTKVILFDRTIDADESLYEASVISDMAAEGKMAVDWLANQKLDEYNVIHIQGDMGSAAQIGRSGALDEKAKAEANWNIVKQQTAKWSEDEARSIVEGVIAAGTKFNVIYAENTNMAKGAVAALDKANISHGKDGDVIVMGFDCDKWALETLLKGEWNYIGQCNPLQADVVDEIIKKLEKGETVEKKIILEERGFDTTITQDDIDKYGFE